MKKRKNYGFQDWKTVLSKKCSDDLIIRAFKETQDSSRELGFDPKYCPDLGTPVASELHRVKTAIGRPYSRQARAACYKVVDDQNFRRLKKLWWEA